MKYDIQQLIKALEFNAQEVLPNTEDALLKEVTNLVTEANSSNSVINHYIGFEISGLVHVGTGIMTGLKIKRLTDAGVVCHIWLANFHTYLNGKLDGKLETIEKVRKEYFEPCMIECLKVCKVDMSKVIFLDAVNTYQQNNKHSNEGFWMYDLDVCKNLTLSRILKSISVTGKTEGQEVDFGVLRYPAMQVADPYFMNIHIVHAGMDQRKCHVLMREVAYKLNPNHQLKIGTKSIKPIAIHHALLLGLAKPNAEGLEASKMSKSKPDSALFVHDSKDIIDKKLKKAYCPNNDISKSKDENLAIMNTNPLLNWCEKMLFPANLSLTISKLESTGKPKVYNNYQELQDDYLNNEIFPTTLKNAISDSLSIWFEPIREWAGINHDIINYIQTIKK
jgi:tyrosyl-tRNA synthetase